MTYAHNGTEIDTAEGVIDMLGISSSWQAIQGLSIRESVEKIFGLGFELCELGAAHKYEEKAVETVMQLCKEHPDKKFSIHAKFPPDKVNLPEGRRNNNRSNGHYHTMNLADPREHEAVIKAVKKMFDISDMISAEIVGIHGGYAGEVKWAEGHSGFEILEMKSPMDMETSMRNMKIVLEEIINTSEERGIKMAVEVSPPGEFAPIMVNPEAFDWLFSNFSSKYLGMVLDVGHLHVAAKEGSYDPFEFIKKFRSKIFEMHLHDYKDGRDHTTVGTGEIDFERYIKAVGKAKARKIPLVFEYNRTVNGEQAVKGKEMIEKLLK